MPNEQSVLWNIKVSKQTDLSLRTFLGAQRDKKADISEFVEQAVLAHVFHSTIEDIHARNRNTDPGVIEAEIEAAVHEVRTEASLRAKTGERRG